MDNQALEKVTSALQANNALQNVLGITDNTAVPLPDGTKVQDLEQFMAERRRYRGRMNTTDIADFAVYSNERAGFVTEASVTVPCFVDAETMEARVFFNLGSEQSPGHGDHTAQLELKKTSAFNQLLHVDGHPKSQKALAEWLEDWAAHIEVTTSAGEALNLPAAVGAIRRITIGQKSEATSDEQSFGTRRSGMSEVEAKNQDQLPAFVDFTCETYQGLPIRTFRMRVSLMTGDDSPRLTLRIIRLENHEEEMAQQFKERLVHELDGKLIDTFVGSFAP